MERTKTTLFFVIFLLISSVPLFSQTDNVQGSFQIDVPQQIQTLNEQIRIAEINEDWNSYYQLREQLIQAWQQENHEVASLYRNVSNGTPDLTPDGMPTDHPRENISDPNKSILFETPSHSEVLWGDDVMITGGRAYDFSMDISRDDEIFLVVSGRLDGTTATDSIYIYKSTDGGQTWSLWSSAFASTQTFRQVEIMCFDGFPGSTGDSYLLLFFLFDNGWLRVGRTSTTVPAWTYYTLSGSGTTGYATDFAVDRNYPGSNYRAICLYDSATVIKSVRSDPASNGTIWQDAASLGLLGRDLDLSYGLNGGTYASFNGFNSGNLYAFENPNFADPASWGSSITLVNGSTDTTRHAEIITSRDAIPNNIAVAVFERQSGSTFALYSSTKASGGSTWGTMATWVIPQENKWPSLYSRKVNANQVFQGAFERSEPGNVAPRSIRYKSFNGTSWTESLEVSDPSNDVTGLQKPEVGELSGAVTVYAFVGGNYTGVYFDNSSWTSTDINEITSTVPEVYSLEQNYPNPFNPGTSIQFRIPEHSFVTLKIYDVLGKEIVTLMNEEKAAGIYEVDFNADNFSSGIYFYSLSANNFVSTKKMILMK